MLVEVVCCSIEDCIAAREAGAQRIELCSAIQLGGLTPSHSLALASRTHRQLPILAMARPRSGGFVYSPAELDLLRLDLSQPPSWQGVVFGALKEDGTVDSSAIRSLHSEVGSRQTVFHRAFDSTPSAFEALDQLIELGFTRVLTSGHAPTALDGAERLRALKEYARGRIEIIAGGGIRANNVLEVIERSGVDQIHLGPFKDGPDGSWILDKAEVAEVVRLTQSGPGL